MKMACPTVARGQRRGDAGYDEENEKLRNGEEVESSAKDKSNLLGPIFLLTSVLLFSANNSVLAHLLQKRKPEFTACNILCASNVIGFGTFYPLFYKDITMKNLKSLGWIEWLAMFGSSIFSNVIGALLTVEGLAQTSVATTAIMGRLESVWLLLLSVLFSNERSNLWIGINAGIIAIGVITTIIEPAFEGKEMEVNIGLLYLVLGGFGYVSSLLILKRFLAKVPVGIFGLFRIVVGTIVYHILAYIESNESFKPLYRPTLWLQMAWYGPIFVTFGQYVWLKSLTLCDSAKISIFTNFMFILNIMWAVIILGREPTTPEYVGSSIVLISVISSLIEKAQYAKKQKIEEQKQKNEEADAISLSFAVNIAREEKDQDDERKGLMSVCEIAAHKDKYV